MRFLKSWLSRLKSVGWAATEGVLNPLLQLILTPYLLTTLGNREFGFWSLSLAIAAFGPLITFAASAATFNRISNYAAANDGSQCMVAWNTALRVVFIGSTAAVSFAAVIVAFNMKIGGLDNAVFLSIFASVALLFAQEIDSVNGSVIKAHGRFDLAAKVDITFRILWVGTIAITAGLYSNASACILSATAITTLKASVKARIANNLIARTNGYNRHSKREYDKTILKTGLWYFGQALSSTLFNAADKFIVGLIFGMETLSAYAVCSQLAQFTHGVQSSAGQVLLPWATKKFKSNKNDPDLLRYALIGAAAFTLLPLTIAVSAPTILSIWINKEFSSQHATLALALILSYTTLSANIPLHFILLGCNQLKLVTILNVAGGAAAIATGLMMAPFGIVYFALSKAMYAPITMMGIKTLMKKSGI